MTILLAIDLAAPDKQLVLGQREGGKTPTVLFADPLDSQFDSAVVLAGSLENALKTKGLAPGDIGQIAVNLGPGPLNATRCAVTFANGLSFGLKAPIVPLDYFDLLCREYREKTSAASSPLLCLRTISRQKGFAALYRGKNKPVRRCCGMFEPAIAAALKMLEGEQVDTLALAGYFPQIDLDLSGFSRIYNSITETGIKSPSAEVLLAAAWDALDQGKGQLTPLEPVSEWSGDYDFCA